MSKLPIHRAAAPKVHDKLNRGLKQLPQVEIIRPWRGYAVGAVIQPPGVLRDVLLQQKFVKMVEVKKIIEDAPKKKAPVKKKVVVKKVPAEKTEDE